ncbi:hypothetical protein SAMN02745121_07730 [Nannocystis exedens]|uniref:Uncharacterized protein n=1 Tax=Nannocystis exedens TaxID=54 RepID=A0A1I2H411_9BACT|nr:hypothetical protein [Nannocystis exedens]PCC73982.1 hypothetical protein NAEX_07071 [Nannocystis exedens]SFF24974.1 hypothetical protein SAMN02745121_07730 [Nannocystis exedens]
MHHTALVLSLTLAAAPGAAESAPELLPPVVAEELSATLLAPVVLEDVRADVADSELEIRFYLPEVGAVSMTVRADDAGAGVGLVKVEDAIVTEVDFVDGAVVSQASHFATLSTEHALAVVASLLQVWHDNAVTDALADDRGLKCWWAGLAVAEAARRSSRRSTRPLAARRPARRPDRLPLSDDRLVARLVLSSRRSGSSAVIPCPT